MAQSCGIIEEMKEKKDNSTNTIPSLHSHISPGKELHIRRSIHLSYPSSINYLYYLFLSFNFIRSIWIDESLEIEELNFVHPVTLLHDGAIPYLRISFDGTIFSPTATTSSTTSPRKKGMLLLPGSFNPWHEGHWLLMKAAIDYHRKRSPPTTANNNTNDENTTNTDSEDGFLPQFEDCAFELSAFNVDKPGLSVQAILERISQFAGTVTGNNDNTSTVIHKRFVLYTIYSNQFFIISYLIPI